MTITTDFPLRSRRPPLSLVGSQARAVDGNAGLVVRSRLLGNLAPPGMARVPRSQPQEGENRRRSKSRLLVGVDILEDSGSVLICCLSIWPGHLSPISAVTNDANLLVVYWLRMSRFPLIPNQVLMPRLPLIPNHALAAYFAVTADKTGNFFLA